MSSEVFGKEQSQKHISCLSELKFLGVESKEKRRFGDDEGFRNIIKSPEQRKNQHYKVAFMDNDKHQSLTRIKHSQKFQLKVSCRNDHTV